MSDKFRPGDYYLICEASGFKIRRSDAVMQWDGAWVHKDFCDVEHPLETPRQASKARPVYPTRPEPTDVFIDVEESFLPEVHVFTVTADPGSYVMTGTDVTLTNSGVDFSLDFSDALNSQYYPLIFGNWM